jgi:hypothetical protein
MKKHAFVFILSVILIQMLVAISFGEAVCPGQLPAGKCWSQKDVIDSRIDSYAQKALIYIFTNEAKNQSKEASSILCSVKRGDLEGIYLPDQRVPALRAQSVGSGWWKILNGKDSVCYKKPADKAPIIVFSEKIAKDRDLLSSALVSSYNECGFQVGRDGCYESEGGNSNITTPAVFGFKGDLKVYVESIESGVRKPIPNASVHLLYGSANIGGAKTNPQGEARFKLNWPGYYKVSVTATDYYVKDSGIQIDKPGSYVLNVEGVTRTGKAPPQGFLNVCGHGTATVTHHSLGQKTASAEAKREALILAHRDFDNEKTKLRDSIKRKYGTDKIVINETKRIEKVNVKEELEEDGFPPGSDVHFAIYNYVGEARVCAGLSWYISP